MVVSGERQLDIKNDVSSVCSLYQDAFEVLLEKRALFVRYSRFGVKGKQTVEREEEIRKTVLEHLFLTVTK